MYCFRPNKFAKDAFGLTRDNYTGTEMTTLLKKVLGENYIYLLAQDPLSGEKTEGVIRATFEKETLAIGTIEKS